MTLAGACSPAAGPSGASGDASSSVCANSARQTCPDEAGVDDACTPGAAGCQSDGASMVPPADAGGDSDSMGACMQLEAMKGPRSTCPTAPGAVCVAGYCGVDAVPDGVSCSTGLCQVPLIDPCPFWQQHTGERADNYKCACVSGRWSCELCSVGEGVCLAEPDGAAVLPPLDAGRDMVADSDAAPDGNSVDAADAD